MSPNTAAKMAEEKTPARNLDAVSWEETVWNSEDVLKSLDEIRSMVETDAQNAINWYYSKKRTKVWYSQGLRMLAVLTGSIGAVIPFWASTRAGATLTGDAAELAILRTNQWGYVFIVIAGACVAVDKLFGFSTNWMRFVDAATKIQTLLGTFRVEWYRQMALADIGGQRTEAVNKLFDTLLEFTAKCREVIEKETGDWIAEFRSNLTKLTEDTKALQDAREKQIQGQTGQMQQLAKEREQKFGAVTVSIKNFADLEMDFKWSLELDNEPRKANIDRPQFIVKSLDPGTYLISAHGRSSGKMLRGAQTVSVETGKSAVAELELK